MEQQDCNAIAEKYLTPQQRASWVEAQGTFPPEHAEKLDELKARIAAQLPLNPASPEAQRLLDDWIALTSVYKDAVAPEMVASVRKIEAVLAALPEPPANAAVFAFLKDASRARAT